MFTGIGCLKAHSHCRLKKTAKPQAPQRCIANALQKPFKEKLVTTAQDIITPLGEDETVEWCNSFVLVLKPN